MSLSRRTVLSTAAVGIATVAAANAQTPNAPAGTPQPMRPGRGGTNPGPLWRQSETRRVRQKGPATA
jgi:Spy/CpxP family protein refolding chaperone